MLTSSHLLLKIYFNFYPKGDICKISALYVDVIFSCWQLLIAFNFHQLFQLLATVDSWWQLIWKKLDRNFYVHTKVDTCAKFQLSMLIFIFINCISCYQLLTAVDSWWQLLWKKFDWNFYEHTKVDTFAKFQLSRLIFIFINCYQLLTVVDS